MPEDAAKEEPTTRLVQTKSGHILQFDDEAGEEQFRLYHPADAEMLIDKNGTISLTDAQGATVTLDADAGEILAFEPRLVIHIYRFTADVFVGAVMGQ